MMLNLVLTVILIGVALYLVNRFVPMAASIKQILNVFVVIATIIFLCNAMGVFDGLANTPIPRIHSRPYRDR